MTAAERDALGDPFAVLLLKRGVLPTTLNALLAALDALNDAPEGLPEQQAFIVADGGQIPRTPETERLDRHFRWVIARGRGGDIELFVSTAPPFASEAIFLQVLAWDQAVGAYQFYQRLDGSWFWDGSSWDALRQPTRGQGPFDSHVNGGLVMKELKLPWLHWHSQAQSIPPDVLAPDDPLRTAPLFVDRRGAEDLERMVRQGIGRWTRSRLDQLAADGTLRGARELVRQVLTTTTVNIASAPEPSEGDEDALLRLPITFFLDADALFGLLGLDATVEAATGVAPEPPTVARGRYRRAGAQLGLRLMDSRQGFTRPGDVFQAWAVPEPAFEDLDVLDQLLRRGVLSPSFAACLKIVDFANPIGSRARERLMAYVPEVADAAAAGARSIEALMVEAIRAALPGLAEDAPERGLLADLALPPAEREAAHARRIAAYLAAVQARLDTDDGLLDLLRLADSRRRAFRRRRLAEFDLTLPWTDIPPEAPLLRATPDGFVIVDS
jgi:hypothetical protein